MHPQAVIQTELPLVDREDELAFLKELFRHALERRGQVVFVGGEAGVGKTRLVHELGKYARDKGGLFATGPSYEEESSIPYSAWTEVIRSVTRQHRTKTFDKAMGPTLAEVGRLVPELELRAKELGIRGWLSGPREIFAPISGTDIERVRLFQAVTDFLISVSDEKPLVVSLDDVLWADNASLQLLHYISRRIKEHPIILAATYRDSELAEDHQLSRLIIELNRERILKKLRLDRLTSLHVAQIMSNQLGGGSVTPDFVKLVHSRTGGNPFFVEEVIRSLSQDGGIVRSTNGWALKESYSVEIPSTVRALIKQRLSRLGEDTAQTLVLASAMGMEVDYELLTRVSGLNEESLIDQLEAAMQAGLLKEKRGGKRVSYVFSDEQIRDSLYDDLSLIRKRKVHAKIATSAEERYSGERELHVEELAHHYIQAGDTAKAAEFSILAGDRAAALHANQDAKKHYRNVLELLEPDQKPSRLEALTKIADVSNRLGEHNESVKKYREAISIAESLGDSRRIANLYSKLGYAHYVGADMNRALEDLKTGLTVLHGIPNTSEEATICQHVARILLNRGDVEEGLQWCGKAIQLSKQLDHKDVLAHALISRAYGLRPNRKNKSEIFQLMEDALKIAIENRIDEPACRAFLNFGGGTARLKSDYTRAKEIFKQGIEYARKTGQLTYEAWLEAELAFLALIPLGDLDEALNAANRSHKIGSEISGIFTSYSILPMGIVELYRGNLEKAQDYLTGGCSVAENAQNSLVIYQYYWALGELNLRRKDLRASEHYFLKAATIGPRGVWTYPPLEAHFGLLKIFLNMRRLDEAGKQSEKIRELASELDEPGGYAYERWVHGLLSETTGNLREARDAFKASANAWNKLRHQYNYATALFDVSRVMVEPQDREERTAVIGEAEKVMAALGARSIF